MKNLFKYIGLISIILFSFYYTEKISSIVVDNSSLVGEINEKTNEYNVTAVSAIIDDEYITPGLNGYVVNVLKSYNNMKFLEAFNAYYLVYDEVKPDVSVENNKNKIIKNGNPKKNSVAIITINNQGIIEYSLTKSIAISRLITMETFNSKACYEQINYDYESYKKLETKLNNINKNTNICVLKNDLKELCEEKNKYLIEPTVTLSNNNLAYLKNNIRSGNIILINDNVSLTDYKILVKQIYYQDLEIVTLSELISEKRD